MKIYFLVATQPNNLGDLMINRLLIEELLNYGEVYVDSYGLPDNFRKYMYFDEKIINVEKIYGGTIKRFPPFKILSKIRKDDFTHFFMSPGPKKFQFNLNSIALLFIFNYLSLLKIKVNLVGIDLNVKNKILQYLLGRGVNNLRVRSKQNVKNYSIKTLHLNYIPDLAILYKPSLSIIKSKKVAVSFRDISSDYNSFIESLDKCFSMLIRKGYVIEIFYQVIDDYDFNMKIYNSLKQKNLHFIENLLWFNELNFYADKSIVISNRLHVLLIGLIYNAIPLGYIDYNDIKEIKINKIFNSLELEEYIFQIPNKINIQYIMDKYSDHCLKLNRIIEENYLICKNHISSIFN